MVTAQPGFMPQEAVDFVRNDELFEVHSLAAQRDYQFHRFGEVDVAVVVAVDQQNRRLPGGDGRNRR